MGMKSHCEFHMNIGRTGFIITGRKFCQNDSQSVIICHILPLYITQEIYIDPMYIMDHAVLYYKLEGRGFDSRSCHCNFLLT